MWLVFRSGGDEGRAVRAMGERFIIGRDAELQPGRQRRPLLAPARVPARLPRWSRRAARHGFGQRNVRQRPPPHRPGAACRATSSSSSAMSSWVRPFSNRRQRRPRSASCLPDLRGRFVAVDDRAPQAATRNAHRNGRRRSCDRGGRRARHPVRDRGARRRRQQRSGVGGRHRPKGDPIDRGDHRRGRVGEPQGSGTGWVLDQAEGLIVTNAHVVNAGTAFRHRSGRPGSRGDAAGQRARAKTSRF